MEVTVPVARYTMEPLEGTENASDCTQVVFPPSVVGAATALAVLAGAKMTQESHNF